MRPIKILLRFRSGHSRTIKAYTNVRVGHRSSPKQLHLGYFGADEALEDVKDDLLRALVDKWPRTAKPKAIDWEDAGVKLARLRAGMHGSVMPNRNLESVALVVPDTALATAKPRVSRAPSSAAAEAMPAEMPRMLPSATAKANLSREQLSEAVPYLMHIARRVASPDEAADLVQATIERALRAADYFTPGTNLKAWLATILIRMQHDRHRQHARRRTLLQQANTDNSHVEYDIASADGDGLVTAVASPVMSAWVPSSTDHLQAHMLRGELQESLDPFDYQVAELLMAGMIHQGDKGEIAMTLQASPSRIAIAIDRIRKVLRCLGYR